MPCMMNSCQNDTPANELSSLRTFKTARSDLRARNWVLNRIEMEHYAEALTRAPENHNAEEERRQKHLWIGRGQAGEPSSSPMGGSHVKASFKCFEKQDLYP